MTITRRRPLTRPLLALTLLSGACAPEVGQQLQVPSVPPPEAQEHAADELALMGEVIPRLLGTPCDTFIAPMDNEVHDCQRLVRRTPRGGLEYGPLMGIFPNLAVVGQPETIYVEPQLVARISNAGSVTGSHGYDIPGLESPGLAFPAGYCVWLYNLRGLRAAIVPVDPGPPGTCESIPSGWPLEVVPQAYGDAPIERYPDTARWQWSMSDSAHYIGTKCGRAWCTIGRPGFRPTPLKQPSEEREARRAIPGWHDAQFLAVLAPTGELRPGPWATVYPLYVSDSVDWRVPQPTARVEVEPGGSGVGPYREKFNLAGSASLLASTIEVQWDSVPAVPPLSRYVSDTGYFRWSNAPVRTGTQRHGPARSARFRWQEGVDETMWVPCPYYGCCDVEEDGG